ncbi:MAG: hypothetical protein P8R54_22185 [Myxococcota bacterium]|nr:hypothetical protein [Myxococcota bacterium]
MQSTDPIAKTRAWLAENDPDVLAADRSLNREALKQSPLQRLALSASQARVYDRLRKRMRDKRASR